MKDKKLQQSRKQRKKLRFKGEGTVYEKQAGEVFFIDKQDIKDVSDIYFKHAYAVSAISKQDRKVCSQCGYCILQNGIIINCKKNNLENLKMFGFCPIMHKPRKLCNDCKFWCNCEFLWDGKDFCKYYELYTTTTTA
jgi:hypothetical protein